MLKAILFDLDGTLLDSENAWRQLPFKYLFCHDIPVPDWMFGAYDTMRFRRTIRQLIGDGVITETYEQAEAWGLKDIAKFYRSILPLKDGAKELLDYVATLPVHTALITASPHECAEGAVERLGISKYFDTIESTINSDLTKRDKALFDRYLKLFGVRPEECLLIDDALYALTGAKNAGVRAWAVEETTRLTEREEIKALADGYFTSLADVTAELKKIMVFED